MKKKLRISAGFFLAFMLEILLVKIIDVKPIGPEGTEVGFAALNGAVSSVLHFNKFFYMISEVLGIVSLAVAAVFACVGLMQLIKVKNPLKIEADIFLLGVLYVIVLILYVAFDKVAVNYRPIIMPNETVVEPSFPSSHTMLAVTIMSSAMMLVDKYFAKYAQYKWVLAVLAVLTVVTRLLSGVHWFTDIIGGVLISAALLFVYAALIEE